MHNDVHARAVSNQYCQARRSKPNDGELATMGLDALTGAIKREPNPTPASVSSSSVPAAGPDRLWHAVSLGASLGQ